jgi:alpha-L-rhamnosidase
MGILHPGDWTAEWIGYDAPRLHKHGVPFSQASWIWYARDRNREAPAGKRYFGRVLDLPSNRKIERADLAATAADHYTLFLNGKQASASAPGLDSWKTPQQQEVASHLRPGRNIIFVEAEKRAPGPAGFVLWLRVVFAGGATETLVSDGTWSSSDTLYSGWKSEGPAVGEGLASTTLGTVGTPPWRLLDGSMLVLPPPRYLSSVFAPSKEVKRAVLYVSALGLCDVYLNGRRVSEDFFTPGWTDYSKRVYYRTYDITDRLKKGENALGAILADGWFSGYVGWGLVRDNYDWRTRLKLQVHVEYTDGSTEDAGTGPSWKARTGPLSEADFLMGETFDARLASPTSVFPEAAAGEPVDTGTPLNPLLQAHPAPPVRRCGEFPPVSIREPRPGVYVFDLEQTIAGVVRLTVKETRGRRITLRFGERLNPDGSLYTDNLRGARAIDTYVCRGDGVEEWEPRFTFHGFRYVEVAGLSAPPDSRTVTGVALTSDTPPAGEFVCSEEMLNRLASNILWTQRANFIDVPTDCPQRDERLGWTGDAQVYCRAACLNADAQAFYHKWLMDLSDAQREDGQFPMVAPLKGAGDDGGPAWADAGVFVPWTVYEMYGDTTILARHYDSMKRFVEFCRTRSTRELLPPDVFHCFGDWLNIDADTPKEVLFTAFFARSTELLRKTAEVLQHRADAARYHELHEGIVAAFRRAYVRKDGSVAGDTQTAYALALEFGLLDEITAPRAARRLIADIEKRGWHLSTGFVGTKELMLALSRMGRHDVAYRLLLNETFPSWGFTIRNGATSIWERWDGWTPDRGFQDPGMNSFAHYAFGAVYQWMVENIGGITSDGPGFRTIRISPRPGTVLTSARVSYRSVHGLIRSEWKKEGERFTLAVQVPANTKATVSMPARKGSVLESGELCMDREDVRYLGHQEAGRESFSVGSGSYIFESEMP